ncbi:IS66 family insertion sequence element accessory protein TnpB [Salmonella enterica]|nr:IS66 family insertion sequence element accessory protein TnpB [Salmonella enterica]EHR1671231.1 IS66 family insertion sequence element accessory protein TnpB [Salmonella enterica]EHR8097673.1 IS66 family insertion sequence element accessory protein TnpB [Salmonella enterica]EIE9498901.1 IS66 family insertion sequence element accessory protein TnpB [Salmonella enterica]EIQ5377752.1 IS66 family insertion sequence element accessory protein TnpB [Salmonella enterica]
MISHPAGSRIWLVAGITDMRNGFNGLCLFTKRLERGRFVWPVTRDGKVHLTPTRLSMLLEGINWKHPKRTERAGIRI